MSDSVKRMSLFVVASRMGWSVGVNRTFVHLDRRTDLGMTQALFLY